jgi:hypothetical protein
MTRKIPLVAECHRLCRIDGKQFLLGIRNGKQQLGSHTNLHVEDLDAVVDSLTSDNHEVVLTTDLAPRAGRRVLRQASQVRQLAFLGDLSKCSSVLLADGNKFAPIV